MKVLFIGLGSIAHKHISAIHTLMPEAEIIALRSAGSASVEQGITHIYKLEDLEGSPDFIIISNPTRLHAETITKCLSFEKPLMIEKPVFDSLKDGKEIIRKIKDRGIATYIACNLRFHPVITFLKERIKDGMARINEVNLYCGSFLPDWRPGTDYKAGYSANADMGGGAHLDLIHELDYAYWLFGQPVQTMSLKRSVSSLGIKSTDFASYNLVYPGYVVNVILNYYRRTPKRSMEIIFEDGIFHCDLLKCEIVDARNKVIFAHPGFRMADTYTAQMEYFINQVQAGEKTMNDVEEAFQVLKIALHDEQS